MRRLFKARVREKCCSCLTGKKTYELDAKEPMCQYIHTYTKETCPFYKPLNEQKNSVTIEVK